MDKKLRNPSLSLTIQDYIKDYIINNHLKAGDPLPSEGAIAEELGVSRSPVREAVKALQSLGIIEARQGDGLYVREWNFDPFFETLYHGMRSNPRKLAELYQIRVWLEMAVIGDAVKRIKDDEITNLEILMLRWEQAVKRGKPYIEYDQEFHKQIFCVMKNETLVKLFDTFWLVFDLHEESEVMAPDPLYVLHEHQDVLDAVKQRDPELARRMLMQQFTGFSERIEAISARKIELNNRED